MNTSYDRDANSNIDIFTNDISNDLLTKIDISQLISESLKTDFSPQLNPKNSLNHKNPRVNTFNNKTPIPDLLNTPFSCLQNNRINSINTPPHHLNQVHHPKNLAKFIQSKILQPEQLSEKFKKHTIENLDQYLPDEITKINALEQCRPLNRIPTWNLSMRELTSTNNISANAGFILSLIDGSTTIEDIIDLVPNMTAEEVASILLSLQEKNIITFL